MTLDWNEVTSLFERAREIDPQLRRAFVEKNSKSPEIAHQVLELLEHDHPDEFLSCAPGAASVINAHQLLQPGDRVSHFTIQKLLNRGGTSLVYEATQSQPDRLVAIKVLQGGFIEAAAVERFRYEAQALARLQHAAIAQVFEAGLAEIGGIQRPFLAVELIPEALDIISFCEQRGLSLHGRLDLFCHVCDAIAHGHQRGVIHRDIKPGNVLVDKEGNPKVIDFGMARVFEPGNEAMPVTLLGEMLGTPQFMSPEQASGDPLRIDARTDIYSLGVLLYKLVTGHLPYLISHNQALSTAQIIERATILKPSAHRAIHDRDLDTVIMCMLAIEPKARYQSVTELVADLRLYLAAKPIRTGTTPVFHRVRLLIRRNPVAGVLAGALVIGLLVMTAGGVFAVSQIRHQRDVATETAAIFSEVLASPTVAKHGMQAKVVDALDDAVIKVAGLKGEPQVRIQLLHAIARSYDIAGDYRKSLNIRKQLLEEQTRVLGANAPATIASLTAVSESLYDLGDYAAAEPMFLRVWQYHKKHDGTDSLVSANAENNLGLLCLDTDRGAEAQKHFQNVLNIRARHLKDSDPLMATSYFNLGICSYRSDDKLSAIDLFQKCAAIHTANYGPLHREIANPRRMIAQCYISLGKLSEAAVEATEALKIVTAALGPKHVDTATAQIALARVHRAQLQTESASVLYKEALAVYKEALGSDHAWYKQIAAELAALVPVPANNEAANPAPK